MFRCGYDENKRNDQWNFSEKSLDYSLTDSQMSSTAKTRVSSSSLRYGCENEDVRHSSYVALRTFYAFGARSGLNSYHPPRRSHSLCTRSRISRSARESPFPSSLSTDFPVQRSLTANMSEMCYPSSSRTVHTDDVRSSSAYTSTLKVPNRDIISKREYSSRPSTLSPLSPLSLPINVFPIQTTGTAGREFASSERTLSSEEREELKVLRERNKFLEAELRVLRKRLEENQRTETELKRKLEESDASVKKWKSKFEQQQTTVQKEVIKEETKADIPDDLIEQLDSAADKLSKISATKDFKMLQNEIENALKEMQCR